MTLRRTRPGRRASTLIFTLWLMVALAGTALYLGQQVMQTRRRDVNRIAQIQREQAIDGMQRYVLAVLTAQDDPGAMPEVDSYTAEDVAVGDVRVWLLGGSDDPDAEEPVFALRDEAGKLNLNTAPIETRTTRRKNGSQQRWPRSIASAPIEPAMRTSAPRFSVLWVSGQTTSVVRPPRRMIDSRLGLGGRRPQAIRPE